MSKARQCWPSLEPLESRIAPATGLNSFAHFAGAIASPSGQNVIPIHVVQSDFDLPAGQAVLGFALRPASSSSLDPSYPSVIPQQPATVLTLVRQLNIAADRSSLSLAQLTAGDFSVRLQSEGGTNGRYELDVFLAGDADGDFRVTQQDLDLIDSLNGVKRSDREYRLDADVDRSGVINSTDLSLAQKNLGVATSVRPHSITLGIDPAYAPEGDTVVYQSMVRLVGQTTAAFQVALDQGANGSFEQHTTAVSDGSFRFDVNLAAGANSLRVQAAADSFGQQPAANLTVKLQNPLPVTFADPDLQAAVRTALDLPPPSAIQTSDMAWLIDLSVDGNRIDSLAGLESARNLQIFSLTPGNFSDLPQRAQPLDLAPLGKLRRLASLTLEGAGLTNSSLSLVNGLTGLKSLDLRYNRISSLALLAVSPSWQNLYLYGNPLSNVLALKGKFIHTDLPPAGLERADTIAKLAKALNYLPLKIYEYVLNNIKYQAYGGTMKSAQATLETQAGSTLDTAALLVALLKECGVSARFVDGNIEVDTQTVLNWLGVKDAEAAFNVLPGAQEMIRDAGGAVVSFRFRKYWVEASAPKAGGSRWVPLDPSWKFRDFQPGVSGILKAVPFDTAAENDYLSQARQELTYEWYENRVAQYLAANKPGVSLADVPYDGPIHPQLITGVPSSEPYQVRGTPTTFTKISSSRQHRVRLTLQQGSKVLFRYRLVVPEVSLKQITISYPGVGVPGTDAFHMAPELRINGVVVARGSNSLVYGSRIKLKIEHFDPGDKKVDATATKITDVGEYVAVGLDALQISERFLARLQSAVNKAAIARINGRPYSKDDLYGSLLALGVLKFFHEDNKGRAIINGLTGAVKNYGGVESGVASSYMALKYAKRLQNPFIPNSEGPTLDIAVRRGWTWAIDNDNTTADQRDRISGFNGSAQEHATWEELLNVKSISTIKSLQLARERGIPIYRIDSSNTWQINQLTVSQSVKDHIRSLVQKGSTVVVPRDNTPLGRWDGVGYWATGVAFFISGRLGNRQLRSSGPQTSESRPSAGGASSGVIEPPPNVPQGNANDDQFYAGDPVNIANGNVTHDETDILIPAIGMPLAFARHYDSNSNITGAEMGQGWSHTYSHFLSFKSDNTIVWRNDLGHRYVFTPTGGGNYSVPDTLHGAFTAIAGGYRYRNKDGMTYTFNSDGWLVRINDRNGNGVAVNRVPKSWKISSVHDLAAPERKLTFTYSGNLVSSVRDFTGRTWRYQYTSGRLSAAMAPSDAQTPAAVVRYSYYTDRALRGLLREITGPNGGKIRFTYYANRRAYKVTDPEGFTHSLSYNLFRQQTTFVDERANPTVYAYNLAGNLVEKVHPNRATETFAWQGGLMRSSTDPFGKTETYQYDSLGNLTRMVDRGGNATTFTYETTFNQPTSITRPGGRVTQLAYDGNGNPTRVTDALGNVTTMSYDDRGLMVSQTSPRGNQTATAGDFTTTYVYNNAGQVVTRSTDLPSTESFTYDARGHLVSSTDARGNVTTYAYDLLDRPIRTTDAAGEPVTYTYDAMGNLIAATDRLGRTTRFAYDRRQHLLKTTNPDGTILKGAYDPAGNLTRRTDELGRTSTTLFDSQNRAIVTLFADGTSMQTRYDGNGRTVAIIDPRGNVTQFVYDALDRVTATIDALGQQSTRSYDAVGNLTFFTDPLGRTTEYRYDLVNRQTAVIDPLLNTTTTAYDADGNVASVTDPLNHTTQFTYDVHNRLTASSDALNHTTRWSYDKAGNMVSITDPAGNTTTFAYDNLNRQVSETDALGAARTFGYDAAGNRILVTDRDGRTRRFTFDFRDRQTAEQWLDSFAAPIRSMQYAYDAAGQHTAAGDPDSNYAYTYDVVGRTTSVDNRGTPGAPGVLLFYAFDVAGNLVAMVDQINGTSRGTEALSYDALNRVSHISQSGNGVAEKRVDFAYDAAGQLTTLNRFRVAASNYTYDNDGRLTTLAHNHSASTLAQYQWTFDAAGRITQETSPDGSTTFSYDNADQLTAADHSSQPDEGYSYDANGNRTNAGYRTETDNRLLSDGKFTYAYDGEGNRIRRTEIANGKITEYSWDYRNRLTRVVFKDAAGNVTQEVDYTYDVFDRRIAKSVDPDGPGPQAPIVQRFVYDGDNIAFQFDGAGALTHRYLYGPAIDQFLADEDAAGQVLWALTDNLGSVRDLVDSTGSVVDHLSYDSFGRISAETNPAKGTLFAYTGREFDPETGLQYNRARYYDPFDGRFISQDPLSFGAGDANLYRYVGNDPTNAVDPFGLQSWEGFGEQSLGVAEETSLGVGEPGFWESLIPVWGSGRSAINAFQTGRWGQGLFYTALAASDVFLVKSLVTVGIKLAARKGLEIGVRERVLANLAESRAAREASKFEVHAAFDKIFQNKVRGDAFRDEIAQLLENQGLKIDKEVGKWTPFGWRRIDIEVIGPNGKPLGGIETKTGNAAYPLLQRVKDEWLRITKGYWVNVVRE